MNLRTILPVAITVLILSGCTQISDPWGRTGGTPFPRPDTFIPGLHPESKDQGNSLPESIQPGEELTLAQCIVIGLKHNPVTAVTWHARESARSRTGQAGSGYYPSLDLTLGAKRGDPVELDGRSDTGSVNTFNAGFGIRYLLFDGGVRSAGVRGAEAELLSADFKHNAAMRDVALAVEEAYYMLLAARQLERVAGDTVRKARYHVDVASARHNNGIVARSDVLKAETGKAEADLTLVRARSLVRIAHGRLAAAMGLSPSEVFNIADLPEDAHEQEMIDVRELMAQAAKNRPELRSALSLAESKRTGIEGARARHWPEIAVDAGYGWKDRTYVPEENEWSVGLGISVPLFDGFDRRYSLRHAQAGFRKAVAEYEKLLREVELEVWIAYARLTEAGQAIKAAAALVSSARQSALAAEGEYKNGTGSVIGVTDAQTALTAAEVQLVRARLDWYTAMARLERAVGKSLMEDRPDTDQQKEVK